MPSPGTVAVIQRHAGERTQAAGLALALEQMHFVGAEAVTAGPFPETLRRALETAVELGADWTVMLDADVLLFPSALPKLVRLAADHPSATASVAACCLDRFSGTVRLVGVRCYRTQAIGPALDLTGWEDTIRPETRLLQLLTERGFPTYLTAQLVGIHGFEQFYRDLYRTAVVHGVKHRSKATSFIERSASVPTDDAETQVIVAGLREGLTREHVNLDAEPLHHEATSMLRELGLKERPPLLTVENDEILRRLDVRHRWLTRPSNVARLFPGFSRRMSYKEGQPRVGRSARLAWKYRVHLLDPAPVNPILRFRASRSETSR